MKLAILCLAFVISAHADEKKYSLKDLQALAGQGAWSELVEHLGDIPPASRDSAWEKVAIQAGTGLLGEAVNTRDPLNGIQASEALVDKYPHLRKSRSFMDRRAEVGLKAHERCLDTGYLAEECGKSLRTFVERDPESLDLAFHAGKLARLKMQHWTAAPFFRKALAKRSSTRSCADDDVRLSVLSALALPSGEKAHAEAIADAQAILKSQCFAELKDAVLAEFRNDSSYFQANACPVLKEKNALGKVSRKKCA
ncbi:MAG TPA: hypothetical protein VM598_11875 [Bdellovibrionota bacterium]|nr:hypothetical protein [Bdellovibrionota bacterium]